MTSLPKRKALKNAACQKVGSLVGTIKKHLRKSLSRLRYRHTLAVAEWARELAKRHGLSEEKAYLASLCHDIAREWHPRWLSRYVRSKKLREAEKLLIRESNPMVLHGYVAADVAKRRGWVSSPDVLTAIQHHTLGHKRMSKLAKVLFVADFTSMDRRFKKARQLRKVALCNLDKAYRSVMKNKTAYCDKRRGFLSGESF